jgi:stage III sporulation protein AB
MIRLICAVLAAGACALLGFDAAHRLKTRTELLGQWQRALEMMDLKLVHEGISLREVALLEGEGETVQRLAAFSKALKDNPRFTAAQAWQASGKPGEAAEDKVLSACFAALGTGVLEKRRAAIAQAIAQLKALQTEADEKAKRDTKLYRSLGLAGGAALLLILL